MKDLFCCGLVLILATLLLSACEAGGNAESDEEERAGDTTETVRPALSTRADSVAMLLYEASGGPETWAELPYLAFTFAVGQKGRRQWVARHAWNRRTGDYRVEWSAGADSNYVALFNVGQVGQTPPPGNAFLNGTRLDSSARAKALQRARQRFSNDTYWLLAPVKLFDEGVSRTYVPDSSDGGTDVIKVTFDEVGMTPGDRYWMAADAESGRLKRWSFVLERMPSDAEPVTYRWTGYRTFESPAGPVTLSTRKVSPDGGTIYTDSIDVPAAMPDSVYSEF